MVVLKKKEITKKWTLMVLPWNPSFLICIWSQQRTRPAWAGFKTAEEGRANTPFGVGGRRG